MTKLLNHSQAGKLIDRTYKLVSVQNQLRFGQALSNMLHQDHPDLANHFLGSDYDFFYERNQERVLEIFLKYYVE